MSIDGRINAWYWWIRYGYSIIVLVVAVVLVVVLIDAVGGWYNLASMH